MVRTDQLNAAIEGAWSFDDTQPFPPIPDVLDDEVRRRADEHKIEDVIKAYEHLKAYDDHRRAVAAAVKNEVKDDGDKPSSSKKAKLPDYIIKMFQLAAWIILFAKMMAGLGLEELAPTMARETGVGGAEEGKKAAKGGVKKEEKGKEKAKESGKKIKQDEKGKGKWKKEDSDSEMDSIAGSNASDDDIIEISSGSEAGDSETTIDDIFTVASLWRTSETSKPTLNEGEHHFDAGWELHEQSWALFAGPPIKGVFKHQNPSGDYKFVSQRLHGSAIAAFTVDAKTGRRKHLVLEKTLPLARSCKRILLLARETLASDFPSLYYFVSNTDADFVVCFNINKRAAWGVFTQQKMLSIIQGAPAKGLGPLVIERARRGEASRRLRAVFYAIEQLIIRHPHLKAPRLFQHVAGYEDAVTVSMPVTEHLVEVSG